MLQSTIAFKVKVIKVDKNYTIQMIQFQRKKKKKLNIYNQSKYLKMQIFSSFLFFFSTFIIFSHFS